MKMCTFEEFIKQNSFLHQRRTWRDSMFLIAPVLGGQGLYCSSSSLWWIDALQAWSYIMPTKSRWGLINVLHVACSAYVGRIFGSFSGSPIVLLLYLMTFSNGLQRINNYREQHLNTFVN